MKLPDLMLTFNAYLSRWQIHCASCGSFTIKAVTTGRYKMLCWYLQLGSSDNTGSGQEVHQTKWCIIRTHERLMMWDMWPRASTGGERDSRPHTQLVVWLKLPWREGERPCNYHPSYNLWSATTAILSTVRRLQVWDSQSPVCKGLCFHTN